MEAFAKQLNKKIVVPFTRIDHNQKALEDTDTTVSRKSEHENLQYIINTFSSSADAQKDPFQIVQPTRWTSTIASNITIDMSHDYDGKDLFLDKTKRVYNGKESDIMIGYRKYVDACRLISKTKDDIPLTYDEFMKYRPIYITRVNKTSEHGPIHEIKGGNKTLNEKFEFSAHVTADTQMRSFYVKQAYLIFDAKTRVIKMINSKV